MLIYHRYVGGHHYHFQHQPPTRPNYMMFKEMTVQRGQKKKGGDESDDGRGPQVCFLIIFYKSIDAYNVY